MDIRDRVIIALDLPDVAKAEAFVTRLGADANFYKIGYELLFVGGFSLANRLIKDGKNVFIDLKLHDIPNTVERGAAQIAEMGARFLSVHAYPITLAAAARGAAGSQLAILGVSVLTSMDDADLTEAGYAIGVQQLVTQRAQQTQKAGCQGLVCSAADLSRVRASIGDSLTLVTPGIRPKGDAVDDQKRVMTPFEAMKAGANHLVIGRPLTQAPDPQQALRAILEEVRQAL